jgi:hypothetical protein
MEKLIVQAFSVWRRKHLPRGAEPTIRHAFRFYIGLADAGAQSHADHWSTICSALRGAGIIGAAEEHITPRWLTDSGAVIEQTNR